MTGATRTGRPAEGVLSRAVRVGPWGTTWLLLGFMLVNFADKAVLGLAGPGIMREFDISRQEFGAAQAAFFALFSVSALAVSALTRKVRTSVLLLGMALLWSAAQLPMVWAAAGFGTLIVTRVLLGAAEGPAAPVAVHHLHGWFGQRDRTLPTAVLMVGAAAGVAVAAPVLSAVISGWGWRWAFGAVGVIGLVWAVVWRRYGSEGPLAPPVGPAARLTAGETAREAAGETAGAASDAVAGAGSGSASGPASWPAEVPLRRILLSGTFLTASVGSFAAYWLMSSKLTWLPDYLETVLGWDAHRAGLMVGAGAVANGVVLLVHGVVAQRAARRGRPGRLPAGAGAGVLLLLSAAAVTVFATAGEEWLRVPMMFGPMALALPMMTVGQTAVARITPPAQRGIVLGAVVGVFALGGVLAPLVLGGIVDAGATTAQGYENGWLFTAGLLVMAGVLTALFLRPERDADRLGVPETPSARVPVAH
ncbi:MFS transporter [Streptomyces sp. NPDC006482]|uniref:MFS transporter n=1 Tax=Streptomyces sp. NPDC006482 TaxID=3154306 RepID=UPI0033BF0F63